MQATLNRFEKIEQWAEARDLIEGSTPEKQFIKLVEETGELAVGINKDDLVLIQDSIGDITVVLTILAAQYGMTIEECIEAAWQQIKHRKGKMINGVFVKEAT